MTRRTKNIGVPNCHSPILIKSSQPHFDPLPCLLLQRTSSSISIILKPWTWKLIKTVLLCQTWWTSWSHPFSCFAIKHQVLITLTYNFPCTPNSSHMYTMSHWIPPCINTVISIAPPTGHRNSDKHHPIQVTFIVFFSPYHTPQDDMQLKGLQSLWQRHHPSPVDCESISKT